MMAPTIPIDELKAHMARQTKLLDEGENITALEEAIEFMERAQASFHADKDMQAGFALMSRGDDHEAWFVTTLDVYKRTLKVLKLTADQ